ncbi:unnamed protein product [Soboliphyme baturini]|uniref:Uncharacterized protein n=1 Tax=Soboliphyme baturini TaxID=241478 RepID=A0A183J8R8_9BILA|nr:unnamed protein product [Soboliphyme baturini]
MIHHRSLCRLKRKSFILPEKKEREERVNAVGGNPLLPRVGWSQVRRKKTPRKFNPRLRLLVVGCKPGIRGGFKAIIKIEMREAFDVGGCNLLSYGSAPNRPIYVDPGLDSSNQIVAADSSSSRRTSSKS